MTYAYIVMTVPASPPPATSQACLFFLPTAPGCEVKSVSLLVEIIKTCSLGCLLVWSSRPLQVGELSEFVIYWIREPSGFIRFGKLFESVNYPIWRNIGVGEIFESGSYRSRRIIGVRELSEFKNYQSQQIIWYFE